MKKKLELRMEDLAVESFEPLARAARPRGTVRGAEDTFDPDCTTECPSRQPTCGIMPLYFAIPKESNAEGCGEYSIDLPCCM